MPEPSAWRVDSAKRTASSFSGKGAAAAGGRWNPAGIRVVYASRHLSTAALEKFIHLPKPIPAAMKFVKFRIQFNGVAVERPNRLPRDWNAEPVALASQRVGEEWVGSGRTAILLVPSAIVPEEENYVFNPAHPDFARLTISAAEEFFFDPRLAMLR
jgi:RES domain-containing protein